MNRRAFIAGAASAAALPLAPPVAAAEPYSAARTALPRLWQLEQVRRYEMAEAYARYQHRVLSAICQVYLLPYEEVASDLSAASFSAGHTSA